MKEDVGRCKKANRGFTLIEIAIVIVIISIIAAISIPALIRSRIHANEASTIWNLRAVCTAQVSYHSSNNTYGNFESLTSPQQNSATRYLDETWREGSPQTNGYSGNRYFRLDQTGIILFNKDQLPSETDPVISDPVR